jgi:mannose-6-phosphate isomerase-like protein (cupin superfamily)
MTAQSSEQMGAAPPGFWFMGAHVTIHLTKADSAVGISMIEHLMGKDFNVPLHRHEEDETFFILEGRFRFRMDGALHELGVGQSLHVPAGAVHAFRVVSPTGRFLTVTTGGFEAMVRALSQPSPTRALPPQASMTPEETDRLIAVCASHGIEFVGPPIE